jgi:hypothetical protein
MSISDAVSSRDSVKRQERGVALARECLIAFRLFSLFIDVDVSRRWNPESVNALAAVREHVSWLTIPFALFSSKPDHSSQARARLDSQTKDIKI